MFRLAEQGEWAAEKAAVIHRYHLIEKKQYSGFQNISTPRTDPRPLPFLCPFVYLRHDFVMIRNAAQHPVARDPKNRRVSGVQALTLNRCSYP